jgi:hypothetical protein
MKYTYHISIVAGILICFLTSIGLNAQTREDSVSSIKKLIKGFSTEGVGYGNAASKSWYAYIYLHHTLSNEELVNLTFDKIAEVRVYAFMALAHNKYADIGKIKNRLSADKESVFTMQGCIGGEEKVQSIITEFQDRNFDNAVLRTLSLLNTDTEYKRQLYDDLINGRPIKRKVN